MRSYPDEPDIILPGGEPLRRPAKRWPYVLLVVAFLLFLFAHNAVPLYTDWLWFGEVGYRNVFTTTLLAKTAMFFLFGLLFFVLFYLNVWIARRLAPPRSERFLIEQLGPQWGRTVHRIIGWVLLAVAIFLSLWAGRIAADYWANGLEFLHATSFGRSDPVFGNDLGFYVFRMAFLRFLWGFLLSTFLISGIVTVAIHVLDRAIPSWERLPDIARGVRAQILILLAALALVVAFGTRLDAFDLLTSDNGVFTGAGYADPHYRLLAINAQTFALLLTAVLSIVSIWRGRYYRWPLIGIGIWLFALIILGGIVPSAGQALTVTPNQFTMERDYIARNIAFTRLGFGLQNVRSVANFPADESLTAAGLQANRATLDNVRLWDYNFLGKVYAQLQTVKTYYKFEKDLPDGTQAYNIDIDRYTVAGRYRQVMLAAREMDPSGLPAEAQTWQNQKLGYTHGYGLVMSPVNRVLQGAPDYFIKDIPVTITPDATELKVTRPDIYYGQLTGDAVYVDTAQQEFDYPSTSGPNGSNSLQDHYTTYQGRGGIHIGNSELAKLAFSLRLGDANVLLARNFTANTRVLFRRDIRERVMTVAPFLQLDNDPYLVADPDSGRLVWILDGYTLSDQFPYSTPKEMPVGPGGYIAPNYIRNSVKATVDAYDGTVNLYLADPQDPIAQTYARIFPGLLKPLSALPSGLRRHLRYPEDLFRLQRSVYATYHVDDPRVFYLKEDAWAIPVEPNADPNSPGTPAQMEPYYVVMRLPAGTDGPGANLQEEFLLMSPLAPIRREDKNILGWMCARCDGDHYGQLVLYRFPQSVSVNGPSQIVALINSDPTISPQLSLWRSGGSTATFGNLLVIPIEHSLLYIVPLYIESTSSGNKLPQLQKVVVAYGMREAHVAMGNTLDEALSELFAGYSAPSTPSTTAPTPPGSPPSTAVTPSRVPPDVRSLIDQATAQYDQAQQRLKAGDFAGYGAATRQLEATLKALRQAAGGSRR